MAYGTKGLAAALNGVAEVGTHLALHTADPGTTGTGEDTGVLRIAAGWGTATTPSLDSDEVPFAIPEGGGSRTYTHFSVRSASTATAGDYVTGGELDEEETFSDNGGTYNFTATLTSATAA